MFPQVTFRHSDAPSVHELYTLISSCIVSLLFFSLAYVFLTFHRRPFRISLFLSFSSFSRLWLWLCFAFAYRKDPKRVHIQNDLVVCR